VQLNYCLFSVMFGKLKLSRAEEVCVTVVACLSLMGIRPHDICQMHNSVKIKICKSIDI
jgi:hypothetical protein